MHQDAFEEVDLDELMDDDQRMAKNLPPLQQPQRQPPPPPGEQSGEGRGGKERVSLFGTDRAKGGWGEGGVQEEMGTQLHAPGYAAPSAPIVLPSLR